MQLSLYDLNNDKAPRDLSSITTKGLMSPEDKLKLNGIEDNANKYIHPATHPASMITGLASGQTSTKRNVHYYFSALRLP